MKWKYFDNCNLILLVILLLNVYKIGSMFQSNRILHVRIVHLLAALDLIMNLIMINSKMNKDSKKGLFCKKKERIIESFKKLYFLFLQKKKKTKSIFFHFKWPIILW